MSVAILTAVDVADLNAEIAGSRAPIALVLYRPATDATLPAQTVQLVWISTRAATPEASPGALATMVDLQFWKVAPFDVKVGDRFEVDAHRGGRITGVGTDQVLGLIRADGELDRGTA